MSTLEMLDVAIGIIFMFLIISLICTAVNEILEGFLKKRASDLEQGIRALLNDKEGTGMSEGIYKHPLILGIFRGAYKPGAKNLPSYIPARNFALALMDNVLPGVPKSVAKQDVAQAEAAALAAAPGTDTALAAAQANAAGKAVEAAPLNDFRSAVIKIGETQPEVSRALLTLVDAAGDDINKVRENIENWYNSSMDRVSGWYKRRTQLISLLIGLLIAIAINADTIAVFKSLSNDDALRNTVVAAAQEYVKAENQTQTSRGIAQISGTTSGTSRSSTTSGGATSGSTGTTSGATTGGTTAGTTSGATIDSTTTGTASGGTTTGTTSGTSSGSTTSGGAVAVIPPNQRIEETLNQLQELRLPIGWDWEDPLGTVETARSSLQDALKENKQDKAKIALATLNLKKAVYDSTKYVKNFNAISNRSLAIPTSGGGWFLKAIGWLITAMAVSLGAPFWFDLLNKFMVIRSTVKPTEKSPEEASEDRQRKTS
jgi:hypothetical protein